MKNTWFTSDTHFGHKNIVRGVSNWNDIDSTRDFKTLEEHDEMLISNFNSLVKQDDVLYHLGDWSFGNVNNISKFRNRLICKEIHLIFGNHDQHIIPLDSPHRNIFSSCNHTLELRLGKSYQEMIFLSHYSHQVWNKSHKGSLHLFGHSHGNLKGIGKSMDVGVDTNNFNPYHLEEITKLLKSIPIQVLDHHTPKD